MIVLFRFISISRVIIRHGLDDVLLTQPALRLIRFLYYLFPWNWKKRPKAHQQPHARRIRCALEDLGPVFVKLGQMLSTRRDLLDDELADELARLQDNVPPFCHNESRQLIEKTYQKPVSEMFKSFEDKPLASASIAQVHAATLWDGREVVIKVVRPGIKKIIQRDIKMLYLIAHLAEKFWHDGKRLRPVDIVKEYERTILDELDLVREAANGSQLRRNFAKSDDLYIAEIYWDYATPNVLVMERIYGVPVGDIATLHQQQVNMQRLGEMGVEIFFTQVFTHNFFHADMHPGNIFVDTTDPQKPRYLAIDFGIVGSLSPDDQRYLAENLYAFFKRDYKRVAELHVESGWVKEGTRIDEFESAIRTVCEPIFQQPIKDISFGNVLLRLFQTARRFEMEVQPQLVLLQKTLLNIEGLGRQLYPDLDLWVTAKPFLQRWMDEQVGVRSLFRGLKENLPKILQQLPYIPSLTHDILQQLNKQQLRIQIESQQIKKLQQQIKKNQQKNSYLLTGSLLIIISIFAAHKLPSSMIEIIAIIGGIIFVLGLFKK